MKIGDRIKKRRMELGISQAELTKRCGFRHQSRIAFYELNKRAIPSSVVPILEKALEVHGGWLFQKELFNDSAIASSPESAKMFDALRVVPTCALQIITLEEACMIKKGKSFTPSVNQKIAVESRLSNCKAIKITGDAMTSLNQGEQSFRDGDIILVDEEKAVNPGNFVVAIIDDKGTTVFKQLAEDAGKFYLRSLNNAYPIIPFDKNKMQFVGVAVEKYSITKLLT